MHQIFPMTLRVLLLGLCCAGCTDSAQAADAVKAKVSGAKIETYGYCFSESTGQNIGALSGQGEIPIRFNEKESDSQALTSLRALSWKVLYQNGNCHRIFIVGSIEDPKTAKADADKHPRSFVLQSWYLLTPFAAYEEPKDPLGPAKVVQLESLSAGCFKKQSSIASFEKWQKSEKQFVRAHRDRLNLSILRLAGLPLLTSKTELLRSRGKASKVYAAGKEANFYASGPSDKVELFEYALPGNQLARFAIRDMRAQATEIFFDREGLVKLEYGDIVLSGKMTYEEAAALFVAVKSRMRHKNRPEERALAFRSNARGLPASETPCLFFRDGRLHRFFQGAWRI